MDELGHSSGGVPGSHPCLITSWSGEPCPLGTKGCERKHSASGVPGAREPKEWTLTSRADYAGWWVSGPPPVDWSPDEIERVPVVERAAWEEARAEVYVTENAEKNERRYTHEGCCTWACPLDDVPRPTETECDGCAAWLPVVFLPGAREPREWMLYDKGCYGTEVLEGPELEPGERVPVVERAAWEAAEKQVGILKEHRDRWRENAKALGARADEAVDRALAAEARLETERKRADEAEKALERIAGDEEPYEDFHFWGPAKQPAAEAMVEVARAALAEARGEAGK